MQHNGSITAEASRLKKNTTELEALLRGDFFDSLIEFVSDHEIKLSYIDEVDKLIGLICGFP